MPAKLLIREILGWLLNATGIFNVYLRLRRRGGVSILVYHDPSPETFERHLVFLAKRFSFVSLDTIVDALHNKQWSAVPLRSCVITFDDGHAGNIHLLPLFKKYAVSPTLFLCSGIAATHRRFWWKSGIASVEPFKRLSDDARLSRLKSKGFDPQREYADCQALSADELLAMAPFVNFGAHTRFHPILTQCSDATCATEIGESKKELERLLNKPICHFAYPNGDYTNREIDMVKNAGYFSGRTIRFGMVHKSSDPFTLPAIEVDDTASINVLCAELLGFNAIIKKVLKHFNVM
jgi:peptidoglycan/xylan/chitin deacetylase (PgdA/CDA1 family)